VITRLWRSNCW